MNYKNGSDSAKQSTVDLPSVVANSTPNSNEYFSFKNTKNQLGKSDRKISIVENGLSNSQELFNTSRGQRAPLTKSNESLVHVINNTKLVAVNRKPVVSPLMNQLKSTN